MITVRPQRSDEYEVVAQIVCATSSGWQPTADELRSEDETSSARLRTVRLVAECDGVVVGCAQRGNDKYQDAPHRFVVSVRVLREARGAGVGRALVAALRESLDGVDFTELFASIRDCETEGLRMAEGAGFVAMSTKHQSELPAGSANRELLAGLDGRLQALAASGISIQTLADVDATDELIAQLAALDNAVTADIPSAIAESAAPVDMWRAEFIDHPSVRPDGLFIAFDGGVPIGLCAHWDYDQGGFLIATTGVLRAYRGRGIAMALKLCGARYGQDHGVSLWAFNEGTNAPILALNAAIGFVRRESYVRLLRPRGEGGV